MSRLKTMAGVCVFCGFSIAAALNSYPTREDKERLAAYRAAEEAEFRRVAALLMPDQYVLSHDCSAGHQAQAHNVSDDDAADSSSYAHWSVRGAWEDDFFCVFPSGWLFPYGGGHWDHVWVDSRGALWLNTDDEQPVVGFDVPVSHVPGVSSFEHGLTPSNTYVFAWQGVAENRDGNQLTERRIELCRNGDAIVSTNGVSSTIPYEIPFEHDGYGQDAAWVRANFTRLQRVSPSLTNAEEIISIGYTNWVAQQVGVGLLNGLYMFSAEFLEDPPEPTLLYIGDCSVCVTRAGVYSFVLEKGTEYEFGTWPFNDAVDYWAQDDMADDAPMLTARLDGTTAPGAWTVDGGWSWLWYPELSDWGYQSGYCLMMPTLQGSPAVSHLGPEDFPKTFDAVLSDIPQDCNVEYAWTADSECFDIATPNAKATQISVKSLPRWNQTTMSVTARFKGQNLTSTTTPFTYGTNAAPSVSVSLSYPSVTFLNDDKRSDRIYRLTAVIECDSGTNGTFTVAHSGDDNPLISATTNFVNTGRIFSYRFNTDKNCLSLTNNFYVMSQDVRHGAFTLTCKLADGTSLVARKDYNVIEPICKLITNERGPDGRCLNPSRLTYGTNAWLEVGVRGDFSPSQVQWAITPSTCRVLQRQNYRIQIEPTVTSGVAIVKAKFNDDPHQPTFTLPIVMPRTIPVKAFIVNDAQGEMVTSAERVRRQIAVANEIFDQVGVKFDLQFTGRVMSTNFYALAEHDIASDGSTNDTISAQAASLFKALQA